MAFGFVQVPLIKPIQMETSMNLIKKRQMDRLANLNKQKGAHKSEAKGGNAKPKTVSKLRKQLQKKAEVKVVDTPADSTGSDGSEADLKNLKDDVSDLENRVDDAESEIQAIKEKLDDESDFVGNPELETHKQMLVGLMDEVTSVEDIEERAPYKAEAIKRLEDFVNGFVSSGARYPNIVAVWVMIWLFDLKDIGRAMPLALHLVSQKIQLMPGRFNSNIATFVCDQVYDWAKAQLDAHKSSGPYLEQLIEAMEAEKWELNKVVKGKMYVIYGKHLDALAEYEPALNAYETAMDINPQAGAKKRIRELQAKLKL
ncbi:phage terminase small subunit [Marinomonas aquiplantarum]|nr:phage terminase small subunit [Marinomonas aquiplantarum]